MFTFKSDPARCLWHIPNPIIMFTAQLNYKDQSKLRRSGDSSSCSESSCIRHIPQLAFTWTLQPTETLGQPELQSWERQGNRGCILERVWHGVTRHWSKALDKLCWCSSRQNLMLFKWWFEVQLFCIKQKLMQVSAPLQPGGLICGLRTNDV